jgi:hypothetical protein
MGFVNFNSFDSSMMPVFKRRIPGNYFRGIG